MPSSFTFFARPRFSASLLLELLFMLVGIFAFRAAFGRIPPANTSAVELTKGSPLEPQSDPTGYIYSNSVDLPAGALAACADPQGNNAFYISASSPLLHQVFMKTRDYIVLTSNHDLPEGIDDEGTVTITSDSTGSNVFFGLGSRNLYHFDTYSQQSQIIANASAAINSIVAFNESIIVAHNLGLDLFNATTLPATELLETYHSDLQGYAKLAAPSDGIGSYIAAVFRDSTGMDIFSLDPTTGAFSLAVSYRMDIGWSVVSTVVADGLIYALTVDSNNNGILQILDPSQALAPRYLPVPISVQQTDSMTITNGFIQIAGQQGLNAFSISDSGLTRVDNYDWSYIPSSLNNPDLFLFTGYDTMAFWNNGRIVVISAMPQIASASINVPVTGAATLSLNDFFNSTNIFNLNDLRIRFPAIRVSGLNLINNPNDEFSAADLQAGMVQVAALSNEQDGGLSNANFQLLLPHHPPSSSYNMEITFINPSTDNSSNLFVGLIITAIILTTAAFVIIPLLCRPARNANNQQQDEQQQDEQQQDDHHAVEMPPIPADVQMEQPELKSVDPEPSELEKTKAMVKKSCENLTACLQCNVYFDWFSDDEIYILECDHPLSDQAFAKLLNDKNVCCPNCRTVSQQDQISKLIGMKPLVQAGQELIENVKTVLQQDENARIAQISLTQLKINFETALEAITGGRVQKYSQEINKYYKTTFANLEKYLALQQAASLPSAAPAATAALQDERDEHEQVPTAVVFHVPQESDVSPSSAPICTM